MIHPQFNTDVMKPMKMEPLMDQEVKNLSGGATRTPTLTLRRSPEPSHPHTLTPSPPHQASCNASRS